MSMTPEEAAAFRAIESRMAAMSCRCIHCRDTRWLIGMFAREAGRELTHAETEAEYRAKNPEYRRTAG